MLTNLRPLFLTAVVWGLFAPVAVPLASAQSATFQGANSCSTSGCHGGGRGLDQFITFKKSDAHRIAHVAMTQGFGTRIAEALQIGDASKSARCTVCHSPLEALPASRFAKGVVAEKGVSCESCHGPAEQYLRYHTRKDLTYEQRLAGGIRRLDTFYNRANACVACHLNIDSELVRVGHPELFFELDRQMEEEPPHWKDEGAWNGPKAWMIGQAVGLREIAWKLSTKPDPELSTRATALMWMLRKSSLGAKHLKDTQNYSVIQADADRLARDAGKFEWDRKKVDALLREIVELGPDFRDTVLEVPELRRRARVLFDGVDRLWAALKKEGKIESPGMDTAVKLVGELSRQDLQFDRDKFAAALQQVEVAIELLKQ